MNPPGVKICGLTNRADALAAVEAGADYLGVVLVPGGPRSRTPEEARGLLEGVDVPSVVVVADLPTWESASAASVAGASVIQLHGHEGPDAVGELREAGSWRVWKTLRVRSRDDVRQGLDRYRHVADGLLLDAWHPERLGGTGRSFSWQEVAAIRESFPPGLEVILAGGLRPDNVSRALECLRPTVVDVSSGVEKSPGLKDRTKVEAFVRQVRTAEREVRG